GIHNHDGAEENEATDAAFRSAPSVVMESLPLQRLRRFRPEMTRDADWALLPRRLRLNGEGVQTFLEGAAQNFVHQAVTLDSALAGKGFRYDMNMEMRFTALSPSGMPAMPF